MSFVGLMDKQSVVHPYKGLLFGNKKNKLLTHATTWLNLNYITLSERNQTQR